MDLKKLLTDLQTGLTELKITTYRQEGAIMLVQQMIADEEKALEETETEPTEPALKPYQPE